MKQFSRILKFELMNYLKSKVFVGITIFLMAAIIIVMFIPNIASLFKTDGDVDVDSLTPMYVYSEDKSMAALATEYFKEVFPDYKVTAFEGTLDELKNEITSGKAECAFALN
jgi:ABC-2 type transport system permease protein